MYVVQFAPVYHSIGTLRASITDCHDVMQNCNIDIWLDLW